MSVLGRVRSALTTFPRSADWRRFLLESAWLAPSLAAIGWLGGLVHPGNVDLPALIRVAAIAFVIPALVEEIVFRAALLPAPAAKPSTYRCGLPIVAFVA